MEQNIGPYRVLRLINRGGQGSVYLGYDSRLQRRVAIKIHGLPREWRGRRRLLQEAQLVASIESPRVVQIHDLISSREHLALVMEYVPGCDLEDLLRQQRPAIGSVLAIGIELAAALAAARQQRIVHGDLKAGNVLVTASGHVKLGDFGIARRDLNEGAGGSPTALSPEQLLGQPLDVRSDLFALGRLLYRMLTGETLFVTGGQLDEQALLQQMPTPPEARVADPEGLPGGVSDLVMALLQKDPADRPGNTHQVRQVLREALLQLPSSLGSRLQEEARPWFRPETREDIPVLIPRGLRREGRSRLLATRWDWLPHRLQNRRTLAVHIAGLLVLLSVLGGYWRAHATVDISISRPQLRVASAARLPQPVSRQWLLAEVDQALRDTLGAVRLLGPGETVSRVLVAGAEPAGDLAAGERLQLALECREAFCLLNLTREADGERVSRQAVLFPDAPLTQWRAALRGAVVALYRSHSLFGSGT